MKLVKISTLLKFPAIWYHYKDLFKKYIIESQKQLVISKDSEINELKIELQKQKDEIEQLKSKLTSEELKEIKSNLVMGEYDNNDNTACNVKNDTCFCYWEFFFEFPSSGS